MINLKLQSALSAFEKKFSLKRLANGFVLTSKFKVGQSNLSDF